ncbi:MAG: sensor histidine kinase [Balneolaceae bacterium]|nr:MAG: sensor histidine kinase [Balneolaceae bacterium]
MEVIDECLSKKNQEVISFEYELEISGRRRFFNANNIAFGEDKVIVSVRDITDYQENLDRIKQLLSIQEKQNEKLLNFTHIVSHNLRSHTANMQGLLSLLKMDDPEIFDNPYVDLMNTSAENLNDTIANLNEVLEMTFGDPDDKISVNLYKTVDKSIKSVSTLAKEAGVSLYNEIDKDVAVKSIPAYLDSIVFNMLTNGIKFHRAGVDSYVRVTSSRKDSFLVIQFEDNGVGVDLSLHGEKLFGMYKTFHSHVESKGLGLFITKNQIEVMDGKIDVESEVNKGTTFTIYLPYEDV